MKTSKKRRDGLKRQSDIMATALELFSKKGYHDTKLDDILKKADIAKGTFYLHFNGKDDVLHMIVEHHLGELYQALSVLDISVDKPMDEIINICVTITQNLVRERRFKLFARIMLKDAVGLDAVLLQRLNDFYDRLIRMSELYIIRAQHKGRIIPTLNPLFTAMCIVGAVKELVFQWSVNDENLDIEGAVMTAVDILFRGMVKTDILLLD